MCRQFNYYKKDFKGLTSKDTGIRTGLNMYWDASGKQFYKAHDNHWGLKVNFYSILFFLRRAKVASNVFLIKGRVYTGFL